MNSKTLVLFFILLAVYSFSQQNIYLNNIGFYSSQYIHKYKELPNGDLISLTYKADTGGLAMPGCYSSGSQGVRIARFNANGQGQWQYKHNYWNGYVDFDISSSNQILTIGNYMGGYLTRLDFAGNVLEKTTMDGAVSSIRTDNSGNFFLLANVGQYFQFAGTVFNPINLKYYYRLLKFNASKILQWSQPLDFGSSTSVPKLIVDGNNNFIITMPFSDSLQLNGTTLVKSAGPYNHAILKYDQQFNLMWTLSVKGGGIGDIRRDANNDLYIYGGFCNQVQLGSFTLNEYTANPNTCGDMFFAKLSSGGNPVWMTHIGKENSQELASGWDVSPNGFIYFSGFGNGKIHVGNDSIMGGNYFDPSFYLARLDQQGKLNWWQNVQGSNYCEWIFAQKDESVVFSGPFNGKLKVDNDSLYVTCGSTQSPFFFMLKKQFTGSPASVSISENTNTLPGIYPNPSNGKIYLNNFGTLRDFRYNLSDVCGKTVSAGPCEQSLDLPETPGIYLLTIESAHDARTIKIIRTPGD